MSDRDKVWNLNFEPYYEDDQEKWAGYIFCFPYPETSAQQAVVAELLPPGAIDGSYES